MPVHAASRTSSQTSINNSQPSTKKNSLANISVRSFSDFRAQTSAVPDQSSPPGLRRKPLPPNSSPRSGSISHSDLSIDEVTSGSSGRHAGHATAAASNLKQKSKEPLRSVPATVAAHQIMGHSADDKHRSHHRISSRFTRDSIPGFKTRSKTTPELTHSRNIPSLDQNVVAGAALRLEEDGNGHARPALIRVVSAQNPDNQLNSSRLAGPSSSRPAMSVFADSRSVSDHSYASTVTTSPIKGKHSPPTSKFSSFFGWKSSPKTGIESPTTPFTDHSPSPAISPFHPKQTPTFDRSVPSPRLHAPPAIDTKAANVGRTFYDMSESAAMPAQRLSTNAFMVEELERELREVSSELADSIRREMELEDELDRKLEPAGGLTRRTSDYFSDSGSSGAKSSADPDTRLERLEREKRRLEQEKAQIRAEYSAKLSEEMRRRNDMEIQIMNMEKSHMAEESRKAAERESLEKIRELETFLTETRRRLSQERQSKDNFEDLLAALRSELSTMRSSRDELADEVVPQLKARIEGLEVETNRLQQENFSSPSKPSTFNGGLRRGNSVLNRSGSVKNRAHETPTEIKEIEDQRDALQKALKNLIARHEAQKKEHSRAIRRFQADRDASLALTPVRKGFARNVASLKEEVIVLRRRADDALTQKWQCEESLGGVKMALDRAESETRSLRTMLESQDGPLRDNSTGLGISNTRPDSPASMLTMLRRSIQLATQEKEAAIKEAEAYRRQAKSMADHRLARELVDSASRLDELATILHEHLERNIALRESLAHALHTGEKEQRASTAKVVELQSQLKNLEEQLVSAREESENRFAQNEEVTRAIDGNNTTQVSRLTLAIPAARFTRHRAGEGIFTARSPRISHTRSGKAESLGEATKTAMLGKRVGELEKALISADVEMKTVVQRVEESRGQIARLQGEREQATVGMNKLQTAIGNERQKALRLVIPA